MLYILIITIIFLVIVIVIFLFKYASNKLLYHPYKAKYDTYSTFYKKLYKLTDNPRRIHVKKIKINDIDSDFVYVQNPESDQTILYFHGNAGNISHRFDSIKFLYNYASVIMYDYRSYGRSDGRSSSLSFDVLTSDAYAVWEYAVEKIGVDPKKMSFFGNSLGCSIAIFLASILDKKQSPRSVILHSPFYSISSTVKSTLRKNYLGALGIFASLFYLGQYQSDKWIQNIDPDTNIVIAHSRADEIIDYDDAIKLYETACHSNTNVRFIEIKGGHNNSIITDEYIYAMAQLFDKQ